MQPVAIAHNRAAICACSAERDERKGMSIRVGIVAEQSRNPHFCSTARITRKFVCRGNRGRIDQLIWIEAIGRAYKIRRAREFRHDNVIAWR